MRVGQVGEVVGNKRKYWEKGGEMKGEVDEKKIGKGKGSDGWRVGRGRVWSTYLGLNRLRDPVL